MRNYLTAPLIVDFNITRRCNLTCQYCYANAGTAENKNELTFEEIKTILDQLKELNVLIVRLSGGEPLIRTDYKEIVDYCEELGFLLCTNTNGTMITDDIINCFKKDCFRKIGISLDSYKENVHNSIRGKEYAFNNTMNSIRKIVEEGLADKLSVVITLSNENANVDEIEKFLHFLGKSGIKNVAFQYAIPVGRGDHFDNCSPDYDKWKELIVWLYSNEDTIREELGIAYVVNLTNESGCKFELFFPFIESGRKDLLSSVPGAMSSEINPYISCQAGNSTVAITADGKVYPCELMMCYEKLEAGDLREYTFKEIWNNSNVLRTIRNMKVDDLDGFCTKCSMKDICGGGCRASAYAYSKKINGCDIRCNRVKESVDCHSEIIDYQGIKIVVRKEMKSYYFTNPNTLKMYNMNQIGFIIFKGLINRIEKNTIIEQIVNECKIKEDVAVNEYERFSTCFIKEFKI